MRGMTGELRFDGGIAKADGDTNLKPTRFWRSADGCLALSVRGGQTFAEVGWHADAVAGIVTVTDCALYDRETIASALGIEYLGRTTPELLTLAYLKWREGMLSRLDGDFTFVICDLGRRQMFAAVDPGGMRQLVFRHHPGKSLVFSSSLEGLAAWTTRDLRLPESRLLHPFLGISSVWLSRSGIPDSSHLPAAHTFQASRDGLQMRRYWTPGGSRPALAENDVSGWIDGLRWHMREAVRKRVTDGARIGVMLSGGLDSSAVLALACGILPAGEVTAYSVVDRGHSACPETLAIDRLLASTGATPVQVDVADMKAHAATALDAVARAGIFMAGHGDYILLLSQIAAASGTEVILNGGDADALFSFGDYLERGVRRGECRQMMREARKLDRLLGETWFVPHLRQQWIGSRLPRGLHQMLRAIRSRRRDADYIRTSLLSQKTIERLHLLEHLREFRLESCPPEPAISELPASLMDMASVIDGTGRFQYRVRYHGCELRCPFLDRELMEFAAWIPLSLRLRNGRNKWIQRKAVAPYMPHNVAWRGDKSHLGTHFNRAMLQSQLEQVVNEFKTGDPAISSYVDRKRFLEEAERWKAGSLEAVGKLSQWLLLEHWLQHNHDKVAYGK